MKDSINSTYICNAYYFLRVKIFITHAYTKRISESMKIMNYRQKKKNQAL